MATISFVLDLSIVSCLVFRASPPPPLHKRRQEGESDNGKNHRLEMLLDEGNVAEEVSAIDEEGNPQDAAEDVVGDETGIGHLPHPSNERGEGADDRDEARDDNRLCSIFFVEGFRFYQVLTLQKADILPEHPGSNESANGIIHRITNDRGNGEEHEEQVRIQHTTRRECSCCEEERITGEEWGDDQSRLAEDYDEEDDVRPRSILIDHRSEVFVDVQKNANDI